MRAARQPAQHIFRADNGEAQRLQRAVDGGDEHDAVRPHHLAAFRHEQADIGNVLDHLHVENHIEGLAGVGEVFGRRRAIIDRHARFGGVELRHLDVRGRSVGTDDLGAEPRHRFAQQPAAAADVEDAQAFERPRRARVAAEARGDLVAYPGKPDGIEFVQRAEFPVRVPPFGGERGKALDFVGVDGRSSRFGHTVVSLRPQ